MNAGFKELFYTTHVGFVQNNTVIAHFQLSKQKTENHIVVSMCRLCE